MARFKWPMHALLGVVVVGSTLYGVNWLYTNGYFAEKKTAASSVPPKFETHSMPATPVPSLGQIPFDPPRPSTESVARAPASPSVIAPIPPTSSDTTARSVVPPPVPLFGSASTPSASGSSSNRPIAPPAIKVLTIPWNGMSGLAYANGAPSTAPGSIMAARGLNVTIERQDDYSQMTAELAKFAERFSRGQSAPTEGAAFAIIMGDAYPAFAAAANKALAPFGQSVEAIGIIGFSRGEDACMLPPEMKVNPQKAKGALIGAVARDGDAHICFKWAGDNGIAVNADPKTYDPDAINFVEVSTFTEADEKYIAGYSETRPVVRNGKPTGERRTVVQNGTATWTPGDVKVARERGGLVKVASTKEYAYQMATLVIGVKKWMEAYSSVVENFLAGALEGSEIVLASDAGLLRAAGVMAEIHKEENAAWWAKYFKGVEEVDRTGLRVSLGGSTTSNLADNIKYFGLHGNYPLFRSVYTVFGEMDRTYYPAELPSFPAYDSVVNTTYIERIFAKSTSVAPAARPTFSPTAATTVVAKRAWNIEFETGKATFTPAAVDVLEELLNQIAVTSLIVQISGHTDSVGNPETNLLLSKQRAEAVRTWIMTNAASDFPPERVRTRGYGQTQPIADNATADGRAKNRRVEITLLAQ